MGREVSVPFSGVRLAAGRVAAGLTQDRLAQLLHTQQRRISDWERGVIAPRPELIPKLAAAIGMDALEFLADDHGAPSLEDMRLAAGLTMDEVAERLTVSRSRYRSIEIGATRRDPAPELLEQLAVTFAVPVVTVLRAIEAARL
jgi:transcriptional regulator with XRE-family HTH domain